MAVEGDAEGELVPNVNRPGLVVDVGSSTTKSGLIAGGRLIRLGTFPTVPEPVGEWDRQLRQVVEREGLSYASLGQVTASSVVPALSRRLRAMEQEHDGRPPVRIVRAATAPLTIDYRPPDALGGDRIANAVGALVRWGAPVVVVDVGTAVTCDLVVPPRRFVGGAIAPGPVPSYLGLARAAPHLADLVDDLPLSAARPGGPADLDLGGDLPTVGTSSRDCLRIGMLRGTASLVDELAYGYQRLVGGPCPVVATGGLAAPIADISSTVTAVDPDLTLRGIDLTTKPAG